jgi:hypothetical protein
MPKNGIPSLKRRQIKQICLQTPIYIHGLEGTGHHQLVLTASDGGNEEEME